MKDLKRINFLLKVAQDHKCTLNSEYGCFCINIAQELSDLGYQFGKLEEEDTSEAARESKEASEHDYQESQFESQYNFDVE